MQLSKITHFVYNLLKKNIFSKITAMEIVWNRHIRWLKGIIISNRHHVYDESSAIN